MDVLAMSKNNSSNAMLNPYQRRDFWERELRENKFTDTFIKRIVDLFPSWPKPKQWDTKAI